MRHALAVLALLIATSASAQTYDFTLANDPALCNAQSPCDRLWSGSGQFTVDSATVTIQRVVLFPITSLTGTLNGTPIALFNPGAGAGNMFWNLTTPISPLAPLLLRNAANGDSACLCKDQRWDISMTDLKHPGTGQTLYQFATNSSTPVAFYVSLVPAIPPITFGPMTPSLPPAPPDTAPPPVATPTQVQSFIARQGQMNVGLEIGVPLATALVIYEIHRHWPQHHEALPAGRF